MSPRRSRLPHARDIIRSRAAPPFLPRAVLACALAIALSACNIVGPAVILARGPEKTPKAYELDPTRSIVIYVDDRNNVVPRRALRLEIANAAQEEILKERLVEEVINAQAAMQVVSTESYTEPMTIAAIGRAVEADIVIYATVDRFSLSPDAQTLNPIVELRVKLIESHSGQRIWPDDRAGFPLRVQAPASPGAIPRTLGQRMEMERQIALLAGRRIARLFYDWVDPGKPTLDEQ